MKRNREKDRKDNLRRLAKVYYYFSDLLFKIPNYIGKKLGMQDLTCNLLMPYCEAIENESNCYVTYNLFPKAANDLDNHLTYANRDAGEYCIVMQGPILEKNDFTLETVRCYKRLFPGILVIISTWEGESQEYIQKLEKERNCIVVLNHYPASSGPGNVNFQCVSSLGGMLEAKRNDKKFVMKSRNDMRITMPGTLEMLRQYLEKYAISESAGIMQKYRLIFFGAYLFHPYQAGDFFCFGHVDDMISYYDQPEMVSATQVDANYIIDNKWSYRMLFANPQGENAINIHYFQKVNGKAECDLEEWWKVLSESIIALPLSFLNPLWIKYDYNHEMNYITMSYRRKIMGGGGADNTIVDFSMWLDMFYHRFALNAADYVFYIDMPMS